MSSQVAKRNEGRKPEQTKRVDPHGELPAAISEGLGARCAARCPAQERTCKRLSVRATGYENMTRKYKTRARNACKTVISGIISNAQPASKIGRRKQNHP